MDVNMTIRWVASVWHSVTLLWKILAVPLMADTKTQENNNYNCGLTLHRQPNRLFPKNHFHFSCIAFLSFFFVFNKTSSLQVSRTQISHNLLQTCKLNYILPSVIYLNKKLIISLWPSRKSTPLACHYYKNILV